MRLQKRHALWVVLIALFLAVVVVANHFGEARQKPFSSYSTEPGGTKAAYLLLRELGFQVQRKNGRNWNGEGTLVALGTLYLPDTGDALTLENDTRFLNANIRDNAEAFVELMWPYRGGPIVFEEYGRADLPLTRTDSGLADVTLWSITPQWLQLCVANLILAAFFAMFFFSQRVGKPLPPEGFAGRAPLEGVGAMAGALEKSNLHADCAAYYYRHRARSGADWDPGGALWAQVGRISSERQALELMARIDDAIKEYRHEGKKRDDRPAG